jgi:hypothetical protein
VDELLIKVSENFVKRKIVSQELHFEKKEHFLHLYNEKCLNFNN